MPDVLGYLESKGLNLKKAGGDEVHLSCFYCGEDPQKRGRLYINVNPQADIPGLHQCFICGAKGAFPTIQRHFGDKPEFSEKEDDPTLIKREILYKAVLFYHENLLDEVGIEALKWLMGPERMLSTETIMNRKLGYAPGGNSLYRHLKELGYEVNDILKTGLVSEYKGRLADSLSGMVTIPYQIVGNVVDIRGRSFPYDGSGQKYKSLPGSSARLFNSDSTWGNKEIVVTEGEFDCIILDQLGFKNVVGIPGANSYQDAWNGYFVDAKRIYTIFDNDAAGAKGTAKFLERFGSRVRTIHLGDIGKCDPTSWVQQGHTAEEFKELLNEAARQNSLLVTVDEAHEEHLSIQGLDGIKFGWELMDFLIKPGILPGQIVVIIGKTGGSKTLLLLNIFHRVAIQPAQEKMKFLFVSLEQTRGEWFERARRIHRFYNLEADDEDCLDFWRDRLMIVDKNRVTEEEFRQILDDFEDQMGQPPDLVGVDYLGYFAQSFKGERYERVSDAIMSLKSIAKERRIPMVVPHQVSRIAKFGEEPEADAGRESGVTEETADFVLTIWSPDAQIGRSVEEKQGIVNMRIGKSRHGGRGSKLSFQFAPLTLAIVPSGDPLQQRARNEISYEQIQDDWLQAVFRHRTGLRQ